MKTRTFQAIFLLVFLMPLSLIAQSARESDSASLLNVFRLQTEKWKQAYNSGDAKNLVVFYSEDANYLSSHVVGLVAAGREKLISNFQNGMKMGGRIDNIEILSMRYSCELATLICKYQATNSGHTVIGRNLLVLRKINGAWLIVLHMTVV